MRHNYGFRQNYGGRRSGAGGRRYGGAGGRRYGGNYGGNYGMHGGRFPLMRVLRFILRILRVR